MAGRTRTFIDDTGSDVVRGLNESLMSARIPSAMLMFVAGGGVPPQNQLMLYATEDVYLYDLRAQNFSPAPVAAATSFLRFSICPNDDLTTDATVIANIEDFATHNWGTGAGSAKDMASITTSDADTVTPFIPLLVPAGNYLFATIDNDEGGNPMVFALSWGLYGTSERVELSPAIPAKAHSSSAL